MPDKFNLEDVFVTEGVPPYTFVPPPNYGEILIDIRKAGKPVIIEGQTGTGKTTTIRQILKEVGAEATYLTARRPEDVEVIERIAATRKAGFFVVDDFHRLSDALRSELANISLATHYIKNQAHLVGPGVEIWEFDPSTSAADRLL